MENSKFEFTFEGMPVGYFKEQAFPSKDGSYQYMPYRGLGHYRMQVKLQESGSALCSYDAAGERVVFTVRNCPRHGILVLEKFERSPCSDV